MGKIKRERQKFHITPNADDIDMDTVRVAAAPKYSSPALPLAPMRMNAGENIFAGINIQLDKVNKFIEPEARPDAPSVIVAKKKVDANEPTIAFSTTPSSAKPPERHITKKEKMKMRHEKLLQRFAVVEQARQKVATKNKKKKVQKSNVSIPMAEPAKEAQPKKKLISNLATARKELVSLNDSMPSMDSVLRLKSRDARTGLEPSMSLKSKQRKNQPLQSTSKSITKVTQKEEKKEYGKRYDLFQKLLKTAKSSTSATHVPKQKKYPKKN